MTTHDLTIQTTEGPVAGVDQGTTEAWYGIPYAAPPVGPLRYRRAQAPAQRDGVLPATDWGVPPVQAPMPSEFGGIGEGTGAEDCLTLNIVRPTGAKGPLPVMVWIYGGAFAIGAASNYDPRRLVEAGDVVFVSMNYRVGPLGFLDLSALSTPERTFDTNVGFYDQIRALQWVRDNIAAFGGDPGNVTVFGESAGAMSVLALMCMPDAAGLFHRAIAQSPAPAHANPRDGQEKWARVFAGILGAAEGGEAAALDAASPDDLVRAALALTSLAAREDPSALVFGPCADDVSLAGSPLEVIAAGGAQPVPLVIGTNDNEGWLFMLGARRSGGETIPVLPHTVERVLGEGPARDELLTAYPGFPADEVSSRVGGDLIFWYPTTAAAAAHSQAAPTWLYRFDYVSDDPGFGAFGATHGQEIAHVLGWAGAPATGEAAAGTPRDAEFSGGLMAAWARFAHEGVPGDDGVWPRYSADERRTLILDEVARVEADPRSELRAAWERYAAASSSSTTV